MNFKIGDFVSRNSHNNDILFRVISINNDICYLSGVNLRLYADSNINDLNIEKEANTNDSDAVERMLNDINLDRNEYFYLPGKILHIDAECSLIDRSLCYE